MTNLLIAEWIKMRHRLMPRIIIVIMLGIIALLFWGVGSGPDRINLIPPRGWFVALYFSASIAPFIWPILGGSWAGSEYSWGTIRMILSRRPSRTDFALAGLLVLLATAAVTLVLVLVVATVAGAVVALLTQHSVFVTSGIQSGYGGLLVKMILATLYIFAFYLVLAYTFGTIFRSSSVGIGVGIGITVAQFIAVGILQHFGGVWKSAADHFPTVYVAGLIQRISAEGVTPSFSSSGSGPGIPECLLGIAIYMAVLLAITFYLVRVRDVTS